MLISLSHDIGDYLYDVFVARLDFWFAFGIAAQLLFTARFIVQWLASEKEGRSVVPMAFWFFSIAGGLMTLIYAMVRRDAIIILGQLLSIFIYVRNVQLVLKEQRKAKAGRGPAA